MTTDPQYAPVESVSAPKEFLLAMATEINRCSRENVSNTPDFILAEFLAATLVAFETASRAREKWYGKSLSIGGSSAPSETRQTRDAVLEEAASACEEYVGWPLAALKCAEKIRALKNSAPQAREKEPASTPPGPGHAAAAPDPVRDQIAEDGFERMVTTPNTGYEALKVAAEKFCRRRDAGELRSNQSYADFKAALELCSERNGG